MNMLTQKIYYLLFSFCIWMSYSALYATAGGMEQPQSIFNGLKTINMPALKRPGFREKKECTLRDALKMLPTFRYDDLSNELKKVPFIQDTDNLLLHENQLYVTAYYALRDIGSREDYKHAISNENGDIWTKQLLWELHVNLISYLITRQFQALGLNQQDRERLLGSYATYDAKSTIPMSMRHELNQLNQKHSKVRQQSLAEIGAFGIMKANESGTQEGDNKPNMINIEELIEQNNIPDEGGSNLPLIVIGGGGCVVVSVILDNYINGGGIYGTDKASLLASVSDEYDYDNDEFWLHDE